MKCKKHPTYKAILKPRAKCRDCERMWVLAQRRKPLRLKDVEINLGWVKKKAEILDAQFKEALKEFNAHAKEVGCRSQALRPMMNNLTVLYDNYHSLLAVADMIENGRF